MAKATYGTGSSVMMNVGRTPVISHKGLSASVAFRIHGTTSYALEGNITCSGDTLVWLCDQIGLFTDPDEIERLASSVPDAQGVQLVPAFAGLGAPYFDSDARAILCGIEPRLRQGPHRLRSPFLHRPAGYGCAGNYAGGERLHR
ncbi:MAG: FGGY-family carbohydrate kinase [Clostridia bacterium]